MTADGSNSSRAPRRSKADVVDAALVLLDRVGLPDLSMRRLADELGVQPSALYWHVENKQELLAAVSARILAPVAEGAVLAATLRLGEAARVLGERLHDRLLAHRDGAEVVSSSLALGLVDSPLHLVLVQRYADAGHAAAVMADAVTHFVVGYTFHEQQRTAADAFGVVARAAALAPDDVTSRRPDPFAAALTLITAGADLPAASEPSARR
ncbi:TetR family transcriptional regulator [Microbacterium neimengense]